MLPIRRILPRARTVVPHSAASLRHSSIAFPPHRTSRYLQTASTKMANVTSGAAETDVAATQVANTTGVTPEGIQSTLREKLEAQVVEVDDISGSDLLKFWLGAL